MSLGDDPGAYLRLVANPFLGLFAIIGAGSFLSWMLRRNPFGEQTTTMVIVALLIWLGRLPSLFQYHCLDCGTTGGLRRWKAHICPRSAERRLLGRPRRWRGPGPMLQIVLWIWIALVCSGIAIPWVRRGPFR